MDSNNSTETNAQYSQPSTSLSGTFEKIPNELIDYGLKYNEFILLAYSFIALYKNRSDELYISLNNLSQAITCNTDSRSNYKNEIALSLGLLCGELCYEANELSKYYNNSNNNNNGNNGTNKLSALLYVEEAKDCFKFSKSNRKRDKKVVFSDISDINNSNLCSESRDENNKSNNNDKSKTLPLFDYDSLLCITSLINNEDIKNNFTPIENAELSYIIDVCYKSRVNKNNPGKNNENNKDKKLSNIKLNVFLLFNLYVYLKMTIRRNDAFHNSTQISLSTLSKKLNTNIKTITIYVNLLEKMKLIKIIRNAPEYKNGEIKSTANYYELCNDWYNNKT